MKIFHCLTPGFRRRNFWGVRAGYFEKVEAMIADPSFPKDAAGGLNSAGPKSLGESTHP